jgi:hypothetical protein
VSGTLNWDYLTKGVNPDGRSMVPQQVGGLGWRLKFSSYKKFKVENLNKTMSWKWSGPKLGCSGSGGGMILTPN